MTVTAATYPQSATDRTRWIVARRGRRNPVTAKRPYEFFVEQERGPSGEIENVATVLLTNRECPWRCVMCDLWRNTTTETVPPGSIAGQIEYALDRLPRASVIKLYNSGSFFDAGAIARSEWKDLARLCSGFGRVVLESHPRLVGNAVPEFAALLEGKLEIAMGLETCHPAALEALNKRITVSDYQIAAAFLRANDIAVRTFLLVQVPFVPVAEQELWLQESMRVALNAGSSVVALIPLRPGNGALDALEAREPSLRELEEAQEFGIDLQAGRVFADTWDLRRFSRCNHCFDSRQRRISEMNLSQRVAARVVCESCGG